MNNSVLVSNMLIKKSITLKYLTAFFTMIILPVLIIGGIIYSHYKTILLKHSSQRTEQILDQVALGIDEDARSMSITLSAVANDYELMNSLNQWYQSTDVSEKYQISREIDNYLKGATNYLTDANVVAFYFKDGGFYYYGKVPAVEEKVIRESEWYHEALGKKHKVHIIDSLASISGYNASKVYISAAINPQNTMNANAVELIYISDATTVLETFHHSANSYLFSDVLIIDGSGDIILSQQQTNSGHAFWESPDMLQTDGTTERTRLEIISGEEFLVSSSYVNKTAWTISCLTKTDDITVELNLITRNGAAILFFILTLFGLFSIFYFRNIVFPIKQLIRKMKVVEGGNFDISINVKGEDELYELGNAFNKMIIKVNDLISERNRKEKERSRAEMEALQAQINPHFVANTLSTLRFMAMLAKADNIKEMSEAFLTIVTSAFNRESRFHSVETEINVLKSYVFIMKARYGDKFVVKFEVDDDVRSCHMLKMLIQPIVENAIIHGLADTECNGAIQVRFKRNENTLQVEVEDNGNGIEADRIEKLLCEDQRNKNGFTGLGIKSVDQRIKLNHGENYGLQIESNLNHYTIFRINLPLLNSGIE